MGDFKEAMWREDLRGVAETHILVSRHLFQKVHDLEGKQEESRGEKMIQRFMYGGQTLQMIRAAS